MSKWYFVQAANGVKSDMFEAADLEAGKKIALSLIQQYDDIPGRPFGDGPFKMYLKDTDNYWPFTLADAKAYTGEAATEETVTTPTDVLSHYYVQYWKIGEDRPHKATNDLLLDGAINKARELQKTPPEGATVIQIVDSSTKKVYSEYPVSQTGVTPGPSPGTSAETPPTTPPAAAVVIDWKGVFLTLLGLGAFALILWLIWRNRHLFIKAIHKPVEVVKEGVGDIESTARAIAAKATGDNPSRPPKDWWDEHYSKVRTSNPSYTEAQASGTVGDIWYHQMTESQRQERIAAEK